MRKIMIAGNWKMYKTRNPAVELARSIAKGTGNTAVDVALFPPALFLEAVAGAVKGTDIIVGAQDLHWEHEGAFTGEIAAEMIGSVGGTAVLVGHSERRTFFGDTDAWVNKKVHSALNAGLLPIMCLGERLDERESGKTATVVERQFTAGLRKIVITDALQLVIAYEPVWAIGTGKVATPEQAEEVHAQLRELLRAKYGAEIAENIRILYGGSVKAENAAELLSQPNIDGSLVGGASLKTEAFLAIIQAANDAQQ